MPFVLGIIVVAVNYANRVVQRCSNSFIYLSRLVRSYLRALADGWYWTYVPAMKTMAAVSWNRWVLTDEGFSVAYYGINSGNYYGTESTAIFLLFDFG